MEGKYASSKRHRQPPAVRQAASANVRERDRRGGTLFMGSLASSADFFQWAEGGRDPQRERTMCRGEGEGKPHLIIG